MIIARRPHNLSAIFLLWALAIVLTPAHADFGIGAGSPGVESGRGVLAPSFAEGLWRSQTVYEPSRGKAPVSASQAVLNAVATLAVGAFAIVVVHGDRRMKFGDAHALASPRGPPPG